MPLMTAQATQMRLSQSQAWSDLCWLPDSFTPMTAMADMSPARAVLMPAMWLYTSTMMFWATVHISFPAALVAMAGRARAAQSRIAVMVRT